MRILHIGNLDQQRLCLDEGQRRWAYDAALTAKSIDLMKLGAGVPGVNQEAPSTDPADLT